MTTLRNNKSWIKVEYTEVHFSVLLIFLKNHSHLFTVTIVFISLYSSIQLLPEARTQGRCKPSTDEPKSYYNEPLKHHQIQGWFNVSIRKTSVRLLQHLQHRRRLTCQTQSAVHAFSYTTCIREKNDIHNLRLFYIHFITAVWICCHLLLLLPFNSVC